MDMGSICTTSVGASEMEDKVEKLTSSYEHMTFSESVYHARIIGSIR